jgi:hypothetical protein
MDYIGSKCPVCDKYFHADDDIVVCPECGTPHHRACYVQLGHCYNEEKHQDHFDYAEAQTQAGGEQAQGAVTCPRCGKEATPDSFFCKYCGAPLKKDEAQQQQQQGGANGMPGFGGFQQGVGAFPFMDPLGGVPADTDLGDGVTAGEASKYVKQNTPYFVRVFSNIRNYNKSKFNFAAALFTGGYMLYRKMYKLGAVVAVIQFALYLLSVFIELRFASVYQNFVAQNANGSYLSIQDYFAGVPADQMLILLLPFIIFVLQMTMMIVVGLTFNRLYMKHCKEQIVRIKQSCTESENPETVLQTKGGVNMPLGVSLMITAMIINYLPSLLSGIF